MCTLVLYDQESLRKKIKPFKYQNGKSVKKINLYLFLICTSLFIQNERIESKYSWKRALSGLIERAFLIDKRAPGQSRRAGGVWIPLIEMFLSHFIQSEKNFFFKKATFNEASDHWMLYLSKIVSGGQISDLKFPKS